MSEYNAAYRRRVIITLMCVQVMAGLGHGVTFTMGSLLATKLQGPAWGGTALALTMGGAALWAIPLAKVVALRGRRASLTTGLVMGMLGAASALTGAQLSFFPLVLLGFLFLGAEVAVNLQARFAAVDVAVGKHRGRDLSLVMWCTTVGAVIGPNLFGLTEKLGSSLGLAEYAGAYLVCMCAQATGILALQSSLRPELRPQAISKIKQVVPRMGNYPLVIVAIATVAASHFAMVGVMSMTGVHLKTHGVGLGFIGIVISSHVGAMYALAPLFGSLSDRLGPWYSIAVGTGLNILSCAIVAAGSGSHTIVLVGLLLLGIGWSATLVGTTALLVTSSPSQGRTVFQGRSDLVMNICGAAGGILAGPIVSATSLSFFAGLMIVVIAAQIGLSVAYLRIRGTGAPVDPDSVTNIVARETV